MQALTSWVSGAQALKSIDLYLQSTGTKLLTQARMFDEPGEENGAITLPGFTPFSIEGGVMAADWCVPRTHRDLEEVLAVYEEYADRKLGVVRAPCLVARRVFKSAHTRAFFGAAVRPYDWWQPAVRLVALVSGISRTPAVVQESRVLLQLEDYKLEVTRRGCYSNFRGRVVTAAIPAEDVGIEHLATPPLITSHPLARVLIGAPESVLWAANAAIRAERAGQVAPITGRHSIFSTPRRRSRGVSRHTNADVRGAIWACRDTLEQGGPGNLHELYRQAVPALMGAREFAQVVASPWNAPDRTLGPDTVQRMLERLDLIERRL